MKIEEVCKSRAKYAVAPHWDKKLQRLYYICKVTGFIYCYHYNEKALCRTKIDYQNDIAFIIPIENVQNKFAVAFKKRIAIIQWNGRSARTKILYYLFELVTNQSYDTVSINFGKTDKFGRLYFATTYKNSSGFTDNSHCQKTGDLYRLVKLPNASFNTIKINSNISALNSLTWDFNNLLVYKKDSEQSLIKGFHYDLETGDIRHEYTAMDFSKYENGKFNIQGLITDSDGFLFGFLAESSVIVKINPLCWKVVQIINLPSENIVTCIAFASPNLYQLFVITTNSLTNDGTIFKISELNTNGLPGYGIVL